MPTSAIHGKFNKNERRILRLRQMRRLELTVRPYIESSYLLASDTPMWRQAHSQLVVVQNCMAQFSDRTHSVSSLINDLCPAELSHYELHCKPHERVTDNSTIAISLMHSKARKGGI